MGLGQAISSYFSLEPVGGLADTGVMPDLPPAVDPAQPNLPARHEAEEQN